MMKSMCAHTVQTQLQWEGENYKHGGPGCSPECESLDSTNTSCDHCDDVISSQLKRGLLVSRVEPKEDPVLVSLEEVREVHSGDTR